MPLTDNVLAEALRQAAPEVGHELSLLIEKLQSLVAKLSDIYVEGSEALWAAKRLRSVLCPK